MTAPREQLHTDDLRDALERAACELSFAAGHRAADSPRESERLMAVVAELEALLARTAPR